jgi:hypothetical protein
MILIYDFVVVVVVVGDVKSKLQKATRVQQLVNSLSQRPHAH